MPSLSTFQARSQQDNVVEESSLWFNELMRKALPNSFAPDTKLSSKQKKDLHLFLHLFRDIIVPAEMVLHKKAWDTTPNHPLFDLAQPGFVFQPSAHGQPLPGPVLKRRADDEIIGRPNANGPAIKRRKTSSNASAQAGSASGSSTAYTGDGHLPQNQTPGSASSSRGSTVESEPLSGQVRTQEYAATFPRLPSVQSLPGATRELVPSVLPTRRVLSSGIPVPFPVDYRSSSVSVSLESPSTFDNAMTPQMIPPGNGVYNPFVSNPADLFAPWNAPGADQRGVLLATAQATADASFAGSFANGQGGHWGPGGLLSAYHHAVSDTGADMGTGSRYGFDEAKFFAEKQRNDPVTILLAGQMSIDSSLSGALSAPSRRT